MQPSESSRKSGETQLEQAQAAVSRLFRALEAAPCVHSVGVGNGARYGGTSEPCLVVFIAPEGERPEIPSRFAGLAVYVELSAPAQQQLPEAL